MAATTPLLDIGKTCCGINYVTGVAIFRGGLKNGNSLTIARTL
jgi:hypothetical protein